MIFKLSRLTFLLIVLMMVSCQNKKQDPHKSVADDVDLSCYCALDPKSVDSTSIAPQQAELDNFYSLMAYAVVYKNWQDNDNKATSRGYNIGSVLVDSSNSVVQYARNSVNATMNETQHGEVRLMQAYLNETKEFDLKGMTIYTTLEPCAMCSGMMKLTEIYRTVYGQSDPDFGKALQRLQLISAPCCIGGYYPYPRPVISDKSPDTISPQIDAAYAASGDSSLTYFLASDTAKHLFQRATIMFLHYSTAKYPENQASINQAQAFYNSI